MTQYYRARVTEVVPGSLADEVGVRGGDDLLAINEQPLRDVIDVQIYAAEPTLTLLVERDGEQRAFDAERRYGQPLGLGFETELFDGPLHICRNHCDFCFVAQMPRGCRRSLYVKDDDYRLSFLHGNYITLTNLTEADWARIEAQYLSPLYVSVHAMDPAVRTGLLHHPRAAAIRPQLQRLVAAGIAVHTQAVLVPGRNDGAQLDRTIEELAALYPGVYSLSVVPVGVTREHAAGLRPYTAVESAVVLAQVLAWQARLRETLDVGFVYPSDEWFLRAEREFLPVEAYDGLLPALIENGVGKVTTFAAHWPEIEAELAALGGGGQTWVTGTLFAPVLRRYAARFTEATGIAAAVLAVHNHFFGETVTVAGLLTVEDVLAALESHSLAAVVVLPETMFRGPDDTSLDDRALADVARGTGRRVHLVVY